MSEAMELTAHALDPVQIGERIEALTARETLQTAEVGEAHLAGADPEEIARLDAARKATRAQIEGLEAARDALARRLDREAAARQEAARLARAVECDAQSLAILAEGKALTPALLQIGAQLRDVLARAESLVFAADSSRETRNVLRHRVAAMVGYALQGVVILPRPDAEPACPFTRFADDMRADLARVGLALPPTTATTTETPDHA